jgi:hypothetical protein
MATWPDLEMGLSSRFECNHALLQLLFFRLQHLQSRLLNIFQDDASVDFCVLAGCKRKGHKHIHKRPHYAIMHKTRLSFRAVRCSVSAAINKIFSEFTN